LSDDLVVHTFTDKKMTLQMALIVRRLSCTYFHW